MSAPPDIVTEVTRAASVHGSGVYFVESWERIDGMLRVDVKYTEPTGIEVITVRGRKLYGTFDSTVKVWSYIEMPLPYDNEADTNTRHS